MKSQFPPFLIRTPRSAPDRRRVRPIVEALEDRTVPAAFIVMTLSDAGADSLRDAITRANDEVNNPGPDTIVFAPAVRGGLVALSTPLNPAAGTADVLQPAGPSAFIITTSITIQGTGETLTRKEDATAFRLFQVTGAGNLTLRNLTLTNGLARGGAGGAGGGGAAGLGGAIYNQGMLTIIACTLTANQAIGGATIGGGSGGGGGGLGGTGDAIGNGGPPNGGAGGAGGGFIGGFGGGGGGGERIALGRGDGGIGGFGGGGGGGFVLGSGGGGGFGGGGGSGRSGGDGGPGGFGGAASTTEAGGGSGLGGAIFNQGGNVILANSTLTANTAQGGNSLGTGQNGGEYGGGIFNLNGILTLTNVTVAGNIVQAGIGGAVNNALGGALYTAAIYVMAGPGAPPATATVANCIFTFQGAGSTVHNYQSQPAGISTLRATGPNLVLGLVANHNGTISGIPFTPGDPRLGPLQNNGGPTPTMALPKDSPARDTGDNTAASTAGLTTDQRGFGPRTAGGKADIGAFEFGAVPPVPPARAIAASLVSVKQRRTKRRRLFVRVSFADTGEIKSQVNSPFNKPAYKQIAVAALDTNGDGITDAVQVSAVKAGPRRKRVVKVIPA